MNCEKQTINIVGNQTVVIKQLKKVIAYYVPMERRDVKPVEIQTSTSLDSFVSNNASYISKKQEATWSSAKR